MYIDLGEAGVLLAEMLYQHLLQYAPSCVFKYDAIGEADPAIALSAVRIHQEYGTTVSRGRACMHGPLHACMYYPMHDLMCAPPSAGYSCGTDKCARFDGDGC
jgi:hypothetical protein